MHTLDIIFSILGVFFFIVGLKRGLTGEIFRVIALVGGFLVAFLYYDNISCYFSAIKAPLHIINAIAFFIIYIIIALLILGIGFLVKKAINISIFGLVDRILGGCIGFMKVALLAWAVCLSISSFPIKQVQSRFSGSITYSTYKKLPSNFHLKAIMGLKESYQSLFNNNKKESIDNINKKKESVKKHSDSISKKNIKNKQDTL